MGHRLITYNSYFARSLFRFLDIDKKLGSLDDYSSICFAHLIKKQPDLELMKY